MRFLFVFLAIAVLLVSRVVWGEAEARKLNAEEIDGLLAGNSIEGAWKGKPYRQYFYRGGKTLYQQKGEPISEGAWRAESSTDQYCSQWGPGAWSCYDILSDGRGGIIWRVPSDGYTSPATITEGLKLY